MLHPYSHVRFLSRGPPLCRLFLPYLRVVIPNGPNCGETHLFNPHRSCLFASPVSSALASSGKDGLLKACPGQLSSQGDSSAPTSETILWVQFEDLKRLPGVLLHALCCFLMPAASALLVRPGCLCSRGCSWLQILRPPSQGESASNRAVCGNRREGQLWGEGAGGVLRCSGLESGGAPIPPSTLFSYCIPCCEQPYLEPRKFMA